MTIRQIKFGDPSGSSFHEMVLANKDAREGTDVEATKEEVAAEMLLEGVGIVLSRGLIRTEDRIALKLEAHRKEKNVQTATTIYYEADEEFDKAVTQCSERTNLNGKKKVLQEAIAYYLLKHSKLGDIA